MIIRQRMLCYGGCLSYPWPCSAASHEFNQQPHPSQAPDGEIGSVTSIRPIFFIRIFRCEGETLRPYLWISGLHIQEGAYQMSAATNEMVAGIETEAGGKITLGSEKLQGEGTEEIRSAPPTSKLSVLRAAILMSADSMLTDLRAIREAKTLEEAQAAVNLMIDRAMALSQAAEVAAE